MKYVSLPLDARLGHMTWFDLRDIKTQGEIGKALCTLRLLSQAAGIPSCHYGKIPTTSHNPSQHQQPAPTTRYVSEAILDQPGPGDPAVNSRTYQSTHSFRSNNDCGIKPLSLG